MNKKSEFGWEEIAKILLVLLFLIILIAIAYLFKDKLSSTMESIKNLLRFS
jgi:Tfp pilus assembly protein PilO